VHSLAAAKAEFELYVPGGHGNCLGKAVPFGQKKPGAQSIFNFSLPPVPLRQAYTKYIHRSASMYIYMVMYMTFRANATIVFVLQFDAVTKGTRWTGK
jgi:hypothetical protein